MAGAGVRDILLEGPWRHRDIAANGIRFHVALGEQFSPRRPLVLLPLHGFGEFWWAWRHQIPALDAASARPPWICAATGRDKTPRGYDPQTTAFDVTGVIKSLGFHRRDRRPRLGRHCWLDHAGVRGGAGARPGERRRPSSAGLPMAANGPTLAFFQLPPFPSGGSWRRRALHRELLRSWAADGAGFLTATRPGTTGTP